MIKRTLYLVYYFKQMKWDLLKKFMAYTSKLTSKSKYQLLLESVCDVYKYNISILEYFQFGFYDKSDIEKKEWAGTGFMYEHQLVMNPKSERDILDDKRKFFDNYKDFFVHMVCDVKGLRTDPSLVDKLYQTSPEKLVFKVADGKCGVDVKIIKTDSLKKEDIISFMISNNYDLVEEYIFQHPDLMALSPSAVNTVRIFTELNSKNEVQILGCRQRISVNSPVDNMAAGNLAAPIDEESGVIGGYGVYSDITKSAEKRHPITGVSIEGFQVPFWNEILEMVKKAALVHPQNRSIGWDVVVTSKGPGLIEGNHDWCKLVWQLPVNKGLKYLLQPNYV